MKERSRSGSPTPATASRTFATPLFAAWRAVWDKDAVVREAGLRADDFAEQRNRLRAPDPACFSLTPFVADLHEFNRLSTGAEDFDAEWGSDRLSKFTSLRDRLRPLIDAARWPRWLMLEQAFQDAGRHGDLIMAALALRTMIGDLHVYLELDTAERRMDADSAGQYVAGDGGFKRQYAALLACRVLPRASQRPLSERLHGPEPPEVLKEHYRALNDYVHPNYGSHMAVILPEESQAGRLLLSAFAEIYSRFLTLPWVSAAPAADAVVAEPASGPVDFIAQFDELISRTLPNLRRSLPGLGLPQVVRELDCPLLIRRQRVFFENLRGTEQVLRGDPELLAESTDGLGALCDQLVPEESPHCPAAILDFPRKHPGFGFSPEDWLIQFAGARRLAAALDAAVQDLGPENLSPVAPPYDRWIEMMRRAMELTLTVEQLKENAVRRATVRMLNRRNPLGAVLAGRSLVEHVAVSRWIANRLEEKWHVLEQRARSGQDLKRSWFDELEASVCRFLGRHQRI